MSGVLHTLNVIDPFSLKTIMFYKIWTCEACECKTHNPNVLSCSIHSMAVGEEEQYQRMPFLSHTYERCVCCHVAQGGFHHVNCNYEHCPICLNPIKDCPCWMVVVQDTSQIDLMDIGSYDRDQYLVILGRRLTNLYTDERIREEVLKNAINFYHNRTETELYLYCLFYELI